MGWGRWEDTKCIVNLANSFLFASLVYSKRIKKSTKSRNIFPWKRHGGTSPLYFTAVEWVTWLLNKLHSLYPSDFVLYFFLFGFPTSAFHIMLCALRFRPALVVGIPVAFAIFRFALVMPRARFQLKPPSDIESAPIDYPACSFSLSDSRYSTASGISTNFTVALWFLSTTCLISPRSTLKNSFRAFILFTRLSLKI